MISEDEAVNRAKRVALEQEWAWIDPAHTTLRSRWFGKGGTWEIFSNGSGLGAKVRVVLDAETGAVLEKGYVPR